MKIKHFPGIILIIVLVASACTFKTKEESINEKSLPGKYVHSQDSRDIIFVNRDNTYTHTYNASNGSLKKQKGSWHFEAEINDIFFDDFIFFNDGGPPYFKGTWPPHVSKTEDNILRFQYSENVYYLKVGVK